MRTKKRPRRKAADGVEEQLLTDTIIQAGTRRRVYIASSLGSYGTPRYMRRLDQLRTRFPTAEIIEPRLLFRDSADWLRRWPVVLRRIDVLVFFTDPQGTVAAGTIREIVDAVFMGIPVYRLTVRTGLQPASRLNVRFLKRATPSRLARVEPRAAGRGRAG